MAITSFPFDNQDTTETQYSNLFRELQDSGIVDSYGSSGFSVQANGTNLTLTVQPGFAIVRGHCIQSSAVENVVIPAPSASARVDRVVLRLDPDADSIVLAVVQGTSGSSNPTALTQTDTGIYELPLALIAVASGVTALAPVNITDDRRFIGSRNRVWKTTTRPSAPRVGQLGLNMTKNGWEYWSGTAWTDLAPTLSFTDLDGTPATFPPSPHTHTTAQVTGLDQTLANMSNSLSTKASTTAITNAFTTADNDIRSDMNAGLKGRFGYGLVSAGGANQISLRYGGSGNMLARVDNTEWVLGNRDHTHDFRFYGQTVSRADGSDRVRGNTPAGSGWFSVWVDGNNNFCHNTSSIRYKKNVEDFEVDPRDVLDLRPVVYDRKPTLNEETGEMEPGQRNEVGLIAEEVENTLPWLVQYLDGEVEGLRYDLLPVAMLSVLKDQQARIEALESRIAELS